MTFLTAEDILIKKTFSITEKINTAIICLIIKICNIEQNYIASNRVRSRTHQFVLSSGKIQIEV